MEKTYDGQTAAFLAAVATCMPRNMSSEVMQGWITDLTGLKKILAEAFCPPSQNYITHTFTILVDETKTVEELVVEGNYDWSDSNVTSKNFPRSEEGTKDKKEVALFHFNKTMTSEDVIAEMKKDGYRPATIFELLALGVTQPELQRGFPIIALGSDCTFDGSRHVAYLYESAGGRNLHLLWLDNDWNDNCRFVGLRR